MTYADQCVPALADRRFVDLRGDGTATVPVTAAECFVDTPVTLELPPWLSTTTPTVDVPAGRTEIVDGLHRTDAPDPVPVEVTVVGTPRPTAWCAGAITLVLGDQRVPVDVRVNRHPCGPPTRPAPAGTTGQARFEAPLADADAGSLDVRLTLDGVAGGPEDGYRMLPTARSRASTS